MEPEAQELEEPSDEDEGGGGVGAGELLTFVSAAFRRHVALAVLVALFIGVLGVTIALLLPPLFEARGKIHVELSSNNVRTLSNPGGGAANPDPFSDASDIILSKSNLLELVRTAKLADQWDATRGAKGRALDWIRASLLGPTSLRDKENALAGMLEQQLQVVPEGRYTMSLRVYWGEPLMAAKLVAVGMDRFLDRRLASETAAIRTAIDLLENQFKKATDDLGPALEAVRHATLALRDSGRPTTPEVQKPDAHAERRVPEPVVVAPVAPDPQLGVALGDVRQKMNDIQSAWQQRLQAVQTQLSELRGVYGPSHPTVLQQVRRVEEASVEPAELAHLREEERRLSSLLRESPSAAPGGANRTQYRGVGGERTPSPLIAAATDSPELTTAHSQLTARLDSYNEIKNRMNGAQLELNSVQEAFKLRYKILDKPEPPRKPLKPNRPLLIAASLAAALLIGFLAGGLREFFSGRFVDVWQIRQLGLPLLAEVGPPGEPET